MFPAIIAVNADCFDTDDKEDRAMLMRVVVHAADLSNQCRPYDLATKWAKLKVQHRPTMKKQLVLSTAADNSPEP